MAEEGVQGRKVVARYVDGRLVKGFTFDFSPSRPRFHVFPSASAADTSTLIIMRELKALFFVRDFAGDPARQDQQGFRPGAAPPGQRIQVFFKDGELMVGTAETAISEPPGFFLIPADAGSNNLRAFVVTQATRAVQPVPTASRPLAATGTRSSRSGATGSLPRRLLDWLNG